MPTLVSPGVSVSVVDESMYAPAGQGTVPLVVIASAQDKTDPSTGNTAIGTTSANAAKPFLVTSQRELVTTFGEPSFKSLQGTQIHGDERNEYGLLSTYSYLGISNRAYVIRADVDLDELEAQSTVPQLAPANGTYWLDLANTDWGLFTANTTTAAWGKMTPTVLNDAPNDSGSGKVAANGNPKNSYGSDKEYAIVASVSPAILYQKISTTWEKVGSSNWASATGSPAAYILPGTGTAPTIGATGIYHDVWLKSTPGGQGANVSVKSYSTSTNGWTSTPAPLYSRDDAATATAGTSIATNDVYVQFDDFDDGTISDELKANTIISTTALATSAVSKRDILTNGGATSTPVIMYQLKIRSSGATTTLTGNAASLHSGINLTGSQDGLHFVLNGVDVTVTASGGAGSQVSLADIVAKVNSVQASTGNVVAELDYASATRQYLKLTRAGGYGIYIHDGTASGNTIAASTADLGLTDNVSSGSTAFVYKSLWTDATYEAKATTPKSDPINGTLWYNSSQNADIYIAENDGGTMKWHAYANSKDRFTVGSVVSGGLRDLQMVSAEPTKQSDGVSSLANGDVWIDSDALDSYPKIYKYNSATSKWVLLDNTDQGTDAGVLFGDAVGNPGGADEDAQNWGSVYSSFDSDAPDPSVYPAGILLFNTRLSGYNVKKYVTNYTFDGTNNGSTWVTESGLKVDGSPYMGRMAQRQVIVTKMQAALQGNEDIRAESRFFNLIAAPGYPELLDEMITLSTDRKQTAFVLGDTPFRLNASGTSIQNWATNTANAPTNGEDGLLSASPYAAVYYPSGYTSDLSGNNVTVPATHIALRTLAFNDQVAYPWFAPAGYTRGLVNNATSVGYITGEGEFQAVTLSEGQRDTMYANKVNPIAFIPNRGLIVFGQKTLQPTASALDRINVARLIVHMRYQLDLLAKPFLFEPNDRITRDQVVDTFNRFMEDLMSKRALYDFLVVCDETNNTGARIDKNELWIDIAIQPVKAIEFIYIPLRIKNTGESLTS